MDSLKRVPQKTSWFGVPTRDRAVVLKAEGLVKTYGKRRVVDGVSFEVREGEIVGLLGSNGAGKTTSFRMSCGLIPADAGRVTLNGLDVTDWPMYRRAREGRLGYLPQDRSAFGALTTEQNLYAAMEFLGYKRSEMKSVCEKSLEKFHLTEIRKTRVGMGGSGGLSGGERRRLEIARALLAQPKILLLDEPFANVDPITVEEIQDVVAQLADEGIAVLITDHQVQETLAITDRSYIVDRGKALCSGTPVEVLLNEDARRLYFGAKADALVDEFRKREGRRGRRGFVEPTSDDRAGEKTSAPTPNASDSKNAGRPSLALNRRADGGFVRPTPPPSDGDASANRFAGKIGRIFKRKK